MQEISYRNRVGLVLNQWLNKPLGLALLAFLLLTSLSQKSIALTNSLYEAMVPVSTTLPTKTQPEMIQEGLKSVLIQLSGSEKLVTTPAAKRALESADSYVTRFSFKDDADKKRFLRVKFDEGRVNELLRRLNAPILAETRPSTTVWLVVARDAENPRWVSSESETELYQQLNNGAKLRAMPLLFPLLDLTDTQQVTEKTVWDDDFTALHTASKRYNADVIWIGKLSKQKSGWHGQWTLMANGKAQTWDNTNENLDQLGQDAMDELAKRLGRTMEVRERTPERLDDQEPYDIPDPAMVSPPTESPAKFTRTRSQVSRFRLSVAGIKGIEQYAKLQAYLKTLPGVKEVEVSVANPEETIFDVVAKSDRQAFIDAIASGKVLAENKGPQSVAQEPNWWDNTTNRIAPESTISSEPSISGQGTTNAQITPENTPVAPVEDNGILNYKMLEVL